jgi:hypothetical protein
MLEPEWSPCEGPVHKMVQGCRQCPRGCAGHRGSMTQVPHRTGQQRTWLPWSRVLEGDIPVWVQEGPHRPAPPPSGPLGKLLGRGCGEQGLEATKQAPYPHLITESQARHFTEVVLFPKQLKPHIEALFTGQVNKEILELMRGQAFQTETQASLSRPVSGVAQVSLCSLANFTSPSTCF